MTDQDRAEFEAFFHDLPIHPITGPIYRLEVGGEG